MPPVSVDLAEKLERITEHWRPRVVARMNDTHLKLARFQGEFVWHRHADTDEVFLVLDGELTLRFRDGDVTLRAGELCVVPRGLEHCPVAEDECSVLLIEPAGTVNTGDAGGERTAPVDDWV